MLYKLTVSPKYNVIFAGDNHVKNIRNFLIYYSKTVIKKIDLADYKLIRLLDTIYNNVNNHNYYKVVKTNQIEIYDINNNIIKRHKSLKNSKDLLNAFLFDKREIKKTFDKNENHFNKVISNVYDVIKKNNQIIKTMPIIRINPTLTEILNHYRNHKNIIKEKLKISNKPKKSKECPPNKILNPKTGRCVNKTGKIGKQIIKNLKTKPSKNCPPEKILNPKTERCVKKDGKIGKEIIKNLKKSPSKRKTKYPLSVKQNTL